MHWFKILLLVLVALAVLSSVTRASGWKTKALSPGDYAAAAVIRTLILAGIWHWL